MKVTIPVRRGTGKGHVQMEEFEAPPPATVTIPRSQYEAYRAAAKASDRLAKAEEAYRNYHDLRGDDAIETGRAWDVMRRAGDGMRKALAALRAAGIDMEEK